MPSWMAPVMPSVPDHELVRRIGGGSYGDVWLARTMLGTWRAVKVVFRDRFLDERPYEREFNGIRKFEPLSRGNEAFVDVLQIGRNDAEGYFYYVMELADDAAEILPGADTSASRSAGLKSAAGCGTASDPAVLRPTSGVRVGPGGSGEGKGVRGMDSETYVPKTLAKVLWRTGRLPLGECLELGLTLNLGLAQLHRAGLIHRDIKPSNIIFVGGVPKLADIGLVIDMGEARSFVGTEGFIPPEGPNSAQADLYSLGKVLYEAGMGKDRKDFPEPFTRLAEAEDATGLLEFNAILLKACAANRADRYRSAEEMNVDLALLRSGGSVRRQRRVAGQLRFVQRAGALVTALAGVIAVGWLWQARQTEQMRQLADENLALARQAETNATRARENEAAARERLYAADINLAHQALQADNLRLARALLRNHVPTPGEPDLRGFEWRYLWHQTRSEDVTSLKVYTNSAWVFAFAPDGRTVAVGANDGVTRILKVDTGAEVATLGGTNQVLSLEFSPADDRLAVGTRGEVRVWNPSAPGEIHTLPEAAAPARFSPDGRHLVTLNQPPPNPSAGWSSPRSYKVIRWDTSTWTSVRELPVSATGLVRGSQDVEVQPVFSPDGTRLVLLTGDALRVHRFPGFEEVGVLPDRLPAGISSRDFVALSPDNRTLAIPASKGFGIRLWDLEEHRERRILAGHADHVFSVAFSPDGQWLASCSPDQTIKLWEVATGRLLNTFRGHGDEVFQVAFSPDGRRLVSLGGYDAILKFWDPTARPQREILREPLNPVGFDVDGGLVAFLMPGLRPVMLDPATLELSASKVPALRANTGYVLAQHSVSADGRYQGVWGGPDGGEEMEIWDRRSGQRVCTVPARGPTVSFAPGRGLVATVTANEESRFTTTLWQLPEGTARWSSINPYTQPPVPVLLPDGGTVLTMEMERRDPGPVYRFWRIEGIEPKPWFEFDVDDRLLEAFAPDGQSVALARNDEIELRSLPSMEVFGRLKGHTRQGIRLGFGPDPRTLVSLADDRTTRFWHVPTQRELFQVRTEEQDQGSFGIEFSPDGRALVVRREDTEGELWRLFYAPSFAEIAVHDNGDYRAAAGADPLAWLAVAKALLGRNRAVEALEACQEAWRLTEVNSELAWVRPRLLVQRLKAHHRLGRWAEAGADNQSLLGFVARDPTAPPEAIDLSAFYTAPLTEADSPHGERNDLSELPAGVQTFAGTVFDVRGKVEVIGRAPDQIWQITPERRTGIPIGRRVGRLQFLQAAGYHSRDIPDGHRIGHYRLWYADGRSVELPIRSHVDTSDWWQLDHLPRELPEAVVAWRGSNPKSRAAGSPDTIRLFKRTWENPFPDVEVTSLDFAGEDPRTQPFLVALTAEP
jgi:WD40 repeat protein